ncbi:uncharacterized protein [Haliotis asinina]|uniref:uncharacterized protein n=1 Tax=Haliotis asinina TaxID=109174 RepID=UPI003531D9AA
MADNSHSAPKTVLHLKSQCSRDLERVASTPEQNYPFSSRGPPIISIGGHVNIGPGNILARSRREIDQAIQHMVRTKAYRKLIENLHKGHAWTIITGCPGEGKTILAYFVMKYFQDRDYNAIVIKTPEQYHNINDFGPKTVVMMNDIFGVLALDVNSLADWLFVLDDIDKRIEHTRSSQEDTQFHVVITGRNYILKAAIPHIGKFSYAFQEKGVVVDISDHFPLSDLEKKDILRCHLIRRSIQLNNEEAMVERICQMTTVHGFPHCCRLFVDIKDAHSNPIEFFSNPLVFLNFTTQKLILDEKTRALFYVLLQNGGSVSKASLKERDLFEVADALVDSYLVDGSNTFQISHPSIHWSIVYAIGCKDTEFLIKECPLIFVNKFVTVRNTQPLDERDSPKFTPKIEIHGDQVDQLLNRFVTETELNNLLMVLSHQVFKCDKFVEDYISCLSQKLGISKLLSWKDSRTRKAFIYLSTSSKSSKLLNFIANKHDLTCDELKHAFLGCCEYGSTDAFQFLAGRYPNMDMGAVDENRKTALSLAAENGHMDIVELLLPSVNNIHAKDSLGMTALHCAAEKGQIDVIHVLVQNGIKINEPDAFGRTALHHAAWGGHEDVVCCLVQEGADVNRKDVDKSTALHDACHRGYAQVAANLIQSGACMDIQNDWNDTPLHISASHGSVSVVRRLLSCGCGLSLKNSKGQTAEDIARRLGYKEVLEAILRYKERQVRSSFEHEFT